MKLAWPSGCTFRLPMKLRSTPFILALIVSSVSFGSHASPKLSCEALILGLNQSNSAAARAVQAVRDRLRPPTLMSEKNISPQVLRDIRTMADDILNRFPPTEYAYIGVGRSPSAIMAFLKALGLEQIFNVPLTGTRGANTLSDQDRTLLFEHFDIFAPNAARTHLRKIVLIDYVQSGKSALKALELFKDYYSSQPEKYEVTMFNLIEPVHEVRPFDPDEDDGYMMDELYDPSPLKPQDDIFLYPHLQLQKSALADLLKRQDSDMYGEFGTYRIGSPGNSSSVLLKSSPSYLNLVKEFRIRIRRELTRSVE